MTAAARDGSVGIAVQSVTKAYGAFRALDDVSFEVAAGEFMTLLGPSGSGKTTLLNIIAGFVRPERGRLYFAGEDVTLSPVNKRGLGMVFQNYALFPHMSVAQNVAFPLKVRRVARAEIEERVTRVLRLVQLEALAERNVAALSGGQRQRVALARAVVFSPSIVLMDEPLSALDKNLREQMQVEIRHLHERIGATTIYVTHDQREALTISDRVAVINRGKIVQCDTPLRIYERPADAFVAGFFGETTLVPLRRVGNDVALADGTQIRSTHALPAGDQLMLALRAERLLMPDECREDAMRIPAVLRDAIYQGDSLLVLAEIAGPHRVALRRPLRGGPQAVPERGAHILLGLEPSAVLVVPA